MVVARFGSESGKAMTAGNNIGAKSRDFAPSDFALVCRQGGGNLRLLGGGAVTAHYRRLGDAGLAQGITHRDRIGRTRDRTARRDQIRDPHEIGSDHVTDDHAVGMRVRDVVEAKLAAVV